MACTGISLTAKDGSYVQARTIEGSQLELESWYVVIPRGHEIVSFTPTGGAGLKFKAKYGVVGMSVVREEFIAEGINEAGLSSGLFFFPDYGGYNPYDESHRERTLGDLQVNAWILSQFSTIDEVIEGLKTISGVGDKVASCVALFGFGRLEAFPIDVWMRRAIDEYFAGKLDPISLGKYAGGAQQYIFHYIRHLSEAEG